MTLYNEVISKNSLINGFSRVKDNDGCAGYDNQTVEQFEEDFEHNINRLNTELKKYTYKPQPVIFFERKKENGKSRLLSIFSIRDRVVQSSSYIVLNPLFENEFEKESFGFRKGISRENAARKIYSYYNEGYRWILDADIKQFFDSVDHEILLAELMKIIPDKNLLALLKKWIKAECIVDKNFVSRQVTSEPLLTASGRRSGRMKITKGLLQGSVVSPLFANLYLDKFDEEIKSQNFKLVRYADDFIILAKEKPTAEKALKLTEQLLKDIKLELNIEKTSITSFEKGFKFLGYVFLNSLILPASPKDTSYPQSKQKDKDLSLEAKSIIENLTRKISLDSGSMINESSLKATELGSAFLEALEKKGITLEDFFKTTEPQSPDKNEDSFEADIQTAFLSEEEPEETVPGVDEPFEPPKHLTAFNRILYVQENGTVIKKEGDRIIVEKEGVELLEIPAIKIAGIIIFGNSIITPAVIRYALQKRISITLLSSTGKYYGTIESTFSNNVETERIQLFRTLDNNFVMSFAKSIITAKLNNQRILIMRYARTKNEEILKEKTARIGKIMQRLNQAETLDDVRGFEGVAASAYFNIFGLLIREDSEFFTRRFERTKHPPLDPVNSMLSFGYTLLLSNIYSFLKANGLNPYCGFLHAVRSGHPALASDIIEEFRFAIDIMVLNIINHKILTKRDFYFAKEPGTPCYLTAAARKIFIKQFEYKMFQRVKHKPTGFTVDYRRCINLQVQQFSQFIKGTLPEYQATKLET